MFSIESLTIAKARVLCHQHGLDWDRLIHRLVCKRAARAGISVREAAQKLAASLDASSKTMFAGETYVNHWVAGNAQMARLISEKLAHV